MNVINKIEIRYFRSLYVVSINQINNLNIFTGKNDAGKSNILKALNLFFNIGSDTNLLNFLNDFNKKRFTEIKQDSIKGKQFIQIKITFNRIDGFVNTLPPKFTVTKTWLKDGTVVFGDDLKYLIEKMGKKYNDRNRASLTMFLKKIKYFYVPAIKDKNIFQNLLLDLRNTLYETILNENKVVNDSLSTLNTAISESAIELNKEYRKVTAIETELATSKNLDELFKALNINTKYKDYDIPLDYRGDGIRVRYLPSILDYIAKNSKNICIWGFEEPENSLEYPLANDMVKQFVNEYSKKSQIFITTHSIAFFSINSPKSQLFRCFNNTSEKGTNIEIYNKEKNDLLKDKEIGIFEILKELHNEYENKIIQLEERNNMLEKYKFDLKNLQKPLLLTEGKTDVSILIKAWSKLYNNEMPFIIKSCDVYAPDHEVSAAGVNQLRNQLCSTPYDQINQKVIGLFDRDSEGKKAFTLDSNFTEINANEKRHKNKKVYAILLPVVTGLEKFGEYDNLPIEYYFNEIYLRKRINKKGLELIPDKKETKVLGKVIKIEEATELHFHKVLRETKVFFAENVVPTFEKEAFINFQTLFEIILKIISLDSPNTIQTYGGKKKK